jgi:hypothetical protein
LHPKPVVIVKIRVNGKSLRIQQLAVKKLLAKNPGRKIFILLSAHTNPFEGMFDLEGKLVDVVSVGTSPLSYLLGILTTLHSYSLIHSVRPIGLQFHGSPLPCGSTLVEDSNSSPATGKLSGTWLRRKCLDIVRYPIPLIPPQGDNCSRLPAPPIRLLITWRQWCMRVHGARCGRRTHH